MFLIILISTNFLFSIFQILAGLLVGMVNFLIGFGATLVAYADPSKNDVAEVESVAIAGNYILLLNLTRREQKFANF